MMKDNEWRMTNDEYDDYGGDDEDDDDWWWMMMNGECMMIDD